MKRREFIRASRRRGGSLSLAARAQQPDRVRRIGVLKPQLQTIRTCGKIPRRL